MPIQNSKIKQAILVQKESIDQSLAIENISLFNSSGQSLDLTPKTGSSLIFTPYTTSSDHAATAKVVTSVEPLPGTLVIIKFTNGNTVADVTVSFNGGPARSIFLGGDAIQHSHINLASNGVILCWFDGTYLHQVGSIA